MFICSLLFSVVLLFCFFFNDTATTEIYTLSLHDALPIWPDVRERGRRSPAHIDARFHDNSGYGRPDVRPEAGDRHGRQDRKSTRLNSSHANISYAVFCLKKKKKKKNNREQNKTKSTRTC